eukprot:UN00921
MRQCLKECGFEGSVHGPEDHVTNIVAPALGKETVEQMKPVKIELKKNIKHCTKTRKC